MDRPFDEGAGEEDPPRADIYRCDLVRAAGACCSRERRFVERSHRLTAGAAGQVRPAQGTRGRAVRLSRACEL